MIIRPFVRRLKSVFGNLNRPVKFEASRSKIKLKIRARFRNLNSKFTSYDLRGKKISSGFCR